jgi:hypothetical protein
MLIIMIKWDCMCLEKKLDKEHDKTPYGEWAGYLAVIFLISI